MPTFSKKRVILYVILGFILFILVGGYFFVNYWANQKLPNLLGDQVENKHVNINLLSGNVTFLQPRVKLDSTDTTSLYLNAAAASVKIEGFSLWDLFFSNEISVNHFFLDSLVVVMQKTPAKAQDSTSKNEHNLFVKDLFQRIRVKEFTQSRSVFLMYDKNKADTLYAVNDFGLSAEGIVVDTVTIDKALPLSFNNPVVKIGDIFMKVGDENTIDAKDLSIAGEKLRLLNFQMASVYSKDEFVQVHRYEKARLGIGFDTLEMSGLAWSVSAEGFSLSTEKTLINGLVLDVFKDKKPPQRPHDIKPMLSELIKKIPFSIVLDTLELTDGRIEFEQRPVTYPRAGVITFEDLFATITNVTTDSVRIKENPTTVIDVLCQFMGQGKLETKITIQMDSEDSEFHVTGSLGELPVTYLNQVLSPLAGAEAEGQIHELSFNFGGDDFSANGDLIFKYEDLKLTLVDDERDKKWLMSLFGNVAIRNENLPDENDYRKGEIYFVRYQNKGFWNYLWNSLQVGLMDIVVPLYNNSDKDLEQEDLPKFKEENS